MKCVTVGCKNTGNRPVIVRVGDFLLNPSICLPCEAEIDGELHNSAMVTAELPNRKK